MLYKGYTTVPRSLLSGVWAQGNQHFGGFVFKGRISLQPQTCSSSASVGVADAFNMFPKTFPFVERSNAQGLRLTVEGEWFTVYG